MASSNQELIQKAHEQELEGQESAALAQQVVDFVAAQQATFDAAMATAQATIDQLSATQLPDAERDEISTALDSAKASFDGMQAVLAALVTPPSEPIP